MIDTENSDLPEGPVTDLGSILLLRKRRNDRRHGSDRGRRGRNGGNLVGVDKHDGDLW